MKRLFSETELGWLRRNYGGRTVADTTERFNRKFGRNLTPRQVKEANSTHGFGRALRGGPQPARRLFSDAERDWLRRHYCENTVPVTTERFNRRFGRDLTAAQIRSGNKNNGFGIARRTGPRVVGPDELAWLAARFHRMPRKELRDRFGERYGRRLSLSTLDSLCARYGQPGAPNVGRFRKGHVPANKGRRGYSAPGCEKGWFTKGQKPVTEVPMWSERVSQGSLLVKVPYPSPWPSHRRMGIHRESHWTSKGRWTWQEERGPIPRGHVILHLDGDPLNCDVDNLECVPRAVLQILNHKDNPRSGTPEERRVMISAAILKYRARALERDPLAAQRGF